MGPDSRKFAAEGTVLAMRNPTRGGLPRAASGAAARWLTIAAVALGIAGCATTTMQSTWADPGYAGGPMRKLFVMGQAMRDVTARRVLEDALVLRLQAAGVDAVPAWRSFPTETPVGESSLSASIAESGAQGVLMARLVGVENQVNVRPTPIAGPGFGWYGFYSGWYTVPTVSVDQIVVMETTLFDARTKRLVWSGTSETFNPSSAQKDAPGFADVIVTALGKAGFVPAAKK